MRLTDKCTIKLNGQPWGGGSRPCEFGHIGGDAVYDGLGRTKYTETARAIVGPDTALAARATVAGLSLEHHGRPYKVVAILPRYRPGGRLHHVSLDLEVVSG